MSSKRKQSTLSQSSSESEPETKSKKSKLAELSGGSSDENSDGSRKSRSKSKSRSNSGSGSDSGTARSKSSSKSRSRSAASNKSGSKSGSDKSKSRSRSPRGRSGSDSGTGGSRQSSPAGSGKESRKGSPSSDRKSSPNGSRDGSPAGKSSSSSSSASSDKSDDSRSSNKSKKLKKSKDHKPSSKLQKTLSNSDSEDEPEKLPEKKRIPKKSKKAEKSDSSANETNWRDEFDDGLDDEYIGGEEDRRELQKMTEREREEEFYRRAEKREELKKRFEISQKLKRQQKKKASSSEDDTRRDDDDRADLSTPLPSDPGSRKKGYEEKYGKKFSALNELKAKREEKERKEKLREERIRKQRKNRDNVSESESGSDYEKLGKHKKKKVLKASEIYSSSSSDDGGDVRRKTSSSSSSSSQSDGESDTERQNSKKTVKKAMNIETREELEKIRLSRYKLDKFVHLPIFKKTVIGCFVRIGIGKNNVTGKDVYRCCEIVDTCETGKIYNVMKTRTNIGLKLRHGKDTRIFRLQFVSNSQLTDNEFEKWKKACSEGNLNLPTMAHLQQKEKDIKYAMEYRFSSYDVEKILASKKKFDSGPKNFAMRKADLMKDRDKAQAEGRLEDADELTKKLEELEERAEDLDKKRTSTISTISLINDRNRKKNVERAYEGIHAEEERRRIEGVVDDPFTRRKTQPKLSAGSKTKEPEMTSELLQKLELERKMKQQKEESSKQSSMLILPPPVDISKKAGNKLKTTNLPSVDIFDAHNFDLDINVDDIQSTPITPSINLKPVTAIAAPSGPTKRSLKLDEYKKKRGII